MPIRQSTREQVTAMIEKPDDPRTPIQNALHARYMALVTDNQAAAEALASDAIEEVERLELLISDETQLREKAEANCRDAIMRADSAEAAESIAHTALKQTQKINDRLLEGAVKRRDAAERELAKVLQQQADADNDRVDYAGQLKEALESIVDALGTGECKENTCEGCKAEKAIAIATARAALAGRDLGFQWDPAQAALNEIELSPEQFERFVANMENPKPPTTMMLRAARQHAALVKAKNEGRLTLDTMQAILAEADVTALSKNTAAPQKIRVQVGNVVDYIDPPELPGVGNDSVRLLQKALRKAHALLCGIDMTNHPQAWAARAEWYQEAEPLLELPSQGNQP